MSDNFWRELTRQSLLEEQYEALIKRGIYTQKEIAMAMARFAEAHIFNASEKRLSELEEALVKLARLTKVQP